ncbi:hypothetical protein NQ317_007935 [Molorchus minor]|uniref:THAP-type domain-containing protein n=1 Tax=Molorchus minor TaxID=1323400 RepID=A0ABQ9JQI0_9CUCU|nr:hypothetical protein NQ317_007935 [Molorchus minor]
MNVMTRARSNEAKSESAEGVQISYKMTGLITLALWKFLETSSINNYNLASINLNTSENTDVQPTSTNRNNALNVKLPDIKLPNFNGDYDRWLEFYDTFMSMVDSDTRLDDIRKFLYLKSCITGEAKDCIKSIVVSAANYPVAWKLLRERYENKEILINNHVKALFALPLVVKESHIVLRQLLDKVLKHIRYLEALGEPVKEWNRLLIEFVCVKLNSNLRLADPTFNKSSKIDVLLGATVFWKLLCVGQVNLGENMPTLQNTQLGWVISGIVPTRSDQGQTNVSYELFFLRFPTKVQSKLIWCALLGLNKDIPKSADVCDDHFNSCDVYVTRDGKRRLKIDALPLKIQPNLFTQSSYCLFSSSSLSDEGSESGYIHNTSPRPVRPQMISNQGSDSTSSNETPPKCVKSEAIPRLVQSSSYTSTASETEEQILNLTKTKPCSAPKTIVGSTSDFHGEFSLMTGSRKRKRDYIGDLSSDDFSTPQKRTRNVKTCRKKVVADQRRKIHSLQCTVRSLRKRITSLKSLLTYLRNKFSFTETSESAIKAYNFARQTFNRSLPHLATISKWYKVVDGSPGFTQEALTALSLKKQECSTPVLCNLVMDEMAIRRRVEWTGSKFAGYVDIGTNIDSDILPHAREALVFMVVCLNGSWKVPVGYFLLDGLGSTEKADLDVFIYLDASHMIKLIRNCFASQKILKDLNGRQIKWEYLVKLVEKQNIEGLHAATKIRTRHLSYEREKMKVRLATQTLSKSASDAISFLREDLKDKAFEDSEATTEFLLQFNNIFDILNSRNRLAKYFL